MNVVETIQQAKQSDTSEIAELLSRSPYVHRHLDWQGVLDWIPFSPFLLLRNGSQLDGMITCPPNIEKIAWIRCFACDSQNALPHIWNKLFMAICHHQELQGSIIYSVGLNDWFADLLKYSAFENFQDIVVLYWDRHLPETHNQDQTWQIRPMEPSDLPQVAELDRMAFESMWVNPEDKIALAYNQAEHASVVEMNDEVIGYELSTANHFSAHLARIAIHPKYQQQHIGSGLIVEMFKYFKRKGIDQITVNTQSTNRSSLALYKSMGFESTGESFPVFRYQV
jgi:ribosomal protein S18 acetylase RimI-like enzyme